VSNVMDADGMRMWRAGDLGGVEVLSATITEFAFRPHAHEEFVIALTEAGLGRSAYRGASHVVGPGDLVVLNPEEAHQCGPPADVWTYWVLYPPADMMRDIAAEFRPDRSALPEFGDVAADRDVVASLRRYRWLLQRPGSDLLEREACLAEALVLLVGRHAASHRSPRLLGKEHRAVRRCREYLEEHAPENVTLHALARFADLSPFHLCRLFRKSVGMTPHAYQIQIRVRRAKSLLRAGLPIKQVTAEVGFYDQAHLTRYFKHVVGMTPGRYLKEVT
jgi:AraC-like DNA-binding protein